MMNIIDILFYSVIFILVVIVIVFLFIFIVVVVIVIILRVFLFKNVPCICFEMVNHYFLWLFVYVVFTNFFTIVISHVSRMKPISVTIIVICESIDECCLL